jgi:hypothetical protein
VSSGASDGAFIRARGRMVTWARAAGKGAIRDKTEGAAASLSPARLAVAPAAGKCRRVEASQGGRVKFCGPAGIFQCAGGSTWLDVLSCAVVRRPASNSTWKREERREKAIGLKRK